MTLIIVNLDIRLYLNTTHIKETCLSHALDKLFVFIFRHVTPNGEN